jgi:hypothetical protein
MDILFLNLLKAEDKESDLQNAVHEAWHGTATPSLFVMQDELFRSIDGCPFAYYAPPQMLSLSARGNVLSANGVIARQGIGASTRYHRLVWEIPPSGVKTKWLHMAHGTSPARFYKPTTHLFLWTNDGEEAKADVIQRYPYLKGNYGFKIQAEEFYRKPGLCYGKRTENFTVQILPSEHVFSFEGTAIFTDKTYVDEWVLLALLNSAPVNHWLSIVCAEHKAYNYVEAVPIPERIDDAAYDMRAEAQEGWRLQRSLDVCNLTSPVFVFPAVLETMTDAIESSVRIYCDRITRVNDALDTLQRKINEISSRLYGFTDRLTHLEIDENLKTDEDGQGYQENDEQEEVIRSDAPELTSQFIDYVAGIVLGRWDVRIALDPALAPKLPDPFDPLPVCPPGMLVGPDGLPSEPNRIVSEEWLRARPDANTLPPEGAISKPTIPDTEYPLRIAWNGILVDDPGFNGAQPHRDDIVRRVREVLDLVWKDKAHEIEQEACDILGVSDLRDYFRKPAKFFQDHLKRYSKSRRKAPIYWPLSTASGSYTIWIYYHRLNDQTLYAAVNKYVEPKISEVERGLARIEDELKVASGGEATRLRDRLNETQTFLCELRDLREELLRIAALPYKPNLNDGVIINAAPLNSLFSLRSWANDTKKVWDKLKKGDYDWAHLAYAIWPDRVREVCKKDRSIAIAHGLEELCEVENPASKKKGGRGRRRKENS